MPTSEYWETPWPETLRCLPEKTMLKKHGESWIHCSKKPRLSTLTSQTAGDRMRWSESRRREGGRIRLLHTRIQPPSRRRDSLHLIRSPAVWLVRVDRRGFLEQWIHDSPCFFNIVFSGKQRSVAGHGVCQYSFVAIHLLRSGLPASYHLR